ncbi:MAG: acyl-CoA thioesterase [Chitinophagaceae bacterium]|nr:acyl-CoA thioesterase [Chitinophagaceae bacterium]
MRIKINFPAEFVFSIHIPVRITDINYGGHVGNDRILAYVQEARMAYFAQWGWSEMNAGGCGMIMADSAIQYTGEAFYGDVIKAEICVGNISTVAFDLYYRLTTTRDGLEKEIARIKTGMVCFDYTHRSMMPISEVLRQKIA